jgi:hypothetical protein
MGHVRRTACASAVVVVVAGCGGDGGGRAGHEALRTACDRGSAAVAKLGPVAGLRDVAPVLHTLIDVERSALEAVTGVEGADDPLAARLRGAIVSAERVLSAVAQADPLRTRTMSPLRTAVPAARRAVTGARELVRELCRRAAA